MTRELRCRECGQDRPLPTVDVRMGWNRRWRYVALDDRLDLFCDLCGVGLSGIAVAITCWRGPENCPARDWEIEFGAILSNQEVALVDKLCK